MNVVYYSTSFGIGLAIASQAAINNQLKIVLDGSTLLASLVSFSVGAACLACLCLLTGQRLSALSEIQNANWWMMMGGLLGVVFVYGTTLLAPRLGIAAMLSLIIFGQVAMSMIIDGFSLFGMPHREISLSRGLGVILVVVGVLCVNYSDHIGSRD